MDHQSLQPNETERVMVQNVTYNTSVATIANVAAGALARSSGRLGKEGPPTSSKEADGRRVIRRESTLRPMSRAPLHARARDGHDHIGKRSSQAFVTCPAQIGGTNFRARAGPLTPWLVVSGLGAASSSFPGISSSTLINTGRVLR
jgi:hypothetical protein